jgi:hypothetical protein
MQYLRFRRLKRREERRARTSTSLVYDAEERGRILACVKRGVAASKGDDAKSTLYSLQEQSGVTLDKLVETPDEFVLALRNLLGRGSALIFDSIRSELLLSSVGHRPLNGRIEEFLIAFNTAKGFADR